MKTMNNIIQVIFSGILIGIMPVGHPLFAQSVDVLLPEAIRLEEVKGELESAIDVYEKIIQEYPENKPVAAEAYLRMGMCYEKLGKQEAKDAYRQLLEKYADQETLVSRARIRLALLEKSEDPAYKTGMQVRKVWYGAETDICGEPSPDGRYISFVDWSTGNLAIYDVSTGTKRLLTDRGSWEDPNQWAEYSRWSPDGKQLVYCWVDEANPSWIDLYIVGLDGSEPRKLWTDQTMEWTQCYDWSPDGKYILVCCEKKDKTNHIGLVSVADGSLRLLKELQGDREWNPWPENMCFSRDSRFIAYSFPEEKMNPAGDIYLLSTDGSKTIPIVAHPANDYLLGWSPDGRNLLFASDRNGTLSAWIISYAGETRFRDPVLVKQNIGHAIPIGFTKNGSYYFAIQQRMNNVFAIDLNPETGKVSGPAQKMIRQFEGYNEAPAYSPDGTSIAYISSRSPSIKQGGNNRGGNVLCIKSLETGKAKEIKPSISWFGFPSWSPDGNFIAVLYMNPAGRSELCRIDIQTEEVTLISKPKENQHQFGGHRWSPDGKTFYFGLMQLERDFRSCNIVARDLETGKDDIIYRSENIYMFSVSPDGHWLGLTCPDRKEATIKVVSTDGKQSQTLYRFEEGIELGRVPSNTWSADSKYIYFNMHDPTSDPEDSGKDPFSTLSTRTYELCRIPINGGQPEKLGVKMPSVFLNMNIHPDGQSIAFSSQEHFLSEMWVMENFLSD
jgi:Tol biopolymer transport system component